MLSQMQIQTEINRFNFLIEIGWFCYAISYLNDWVHCAWSLLPSFISFATELWIRWIENASDMCCVHWTMECALRTHVQFYTIIGNLMKRTMTCSTSEWYRICKAMHCSTGNVVISLSPSQLAWNCLSYLFETSLW